MKGWGWRRRKDWERWAKVRLVRDASVGLSELGAGKRKRVNFRQVSVSSWHAHPTVYCRWRWVFEGCVRQKLRGRESTLSQSENEGESVERTRETVRLGGIEEIEILVDFCLCRQWQRPRQEEEEEMENRWRARVEKFGGSSPFVSKTTPCRPMVESLEEMGKRKERKRRRKREVDNNR